MQEFLAGLFDLSFRKLITPKVAKAVYIIAIVAAALNSMAVLQRLPSFSGLIMALASFAVSVVAARVFIEVALSVFQIARYTREIARQGRPRGSELPSETPSDL